MDVTMVIRLGWTQSSRGAAKYLTGKPELFCIFFVTISNFTGNQYRNLGTDDGDYS